MLLLLAACAPFGADDLAPPATAPADLRDACVLATHRCTRCHSLDRILDERVDAPDQWRAIVHRMRLTPGSDIRPDDEPVIARCLVYHSFGEGP